MIGKFTFFFISSSTHFSHIPSQIPSAIALNSASALLATTLCFLLLQVTRLHQTNIQHQKWTSCPPNHLQSASIKISTFYLLDFLNKRPWHGDPIKYPWILYNSFKCHLATTMLSTKAMSGRVWDRYISFPTMHWYLPISIDLPQSYSLLILWNSKGEKYFSYYSHWDTPTIYM